MRPLGESPDPGRRHQHMRRPGARAERLRGGGRHHDDDGPGGGQPQRPAAQPSAATGPARPARPARRAPGLASARPGPARLRRPPGAVSGGRLGQPGRFRMLRLTKFMINGAFRTTRPRQARLLRASRAFGHVRRANHGRGYGQASPRGARGCRDPGAFQHVGMRGAANGPRGRRPDRLAAALVRPPGNCGCRRPRGGRPRGGRAHGRRAARRRGRRGRRPGSRLRRRRLRARRVLARRIRVRRMLARRVPVRRGRHGERRRAAIAAAVAVSRMRVT